MNFEKNSRLKVLIAGGSGLIGRKLSDNLIQAEHEVAWLSRSANPKGKFRKYAWNVKDQNIDESALKWADIVIHLAGAGIADEPWTKTYRKEIINSRVDSTRLLLKAFKKDERLRPLHYLAASAVGYYGDCPPEQEISETHPPGDSGFLAESGRLWEDAIQEVADLVPTCWLRTGPVLSSEGGMIPKVLLPLKLGSAAYFGHGRQILPWIHLDDLVNMYLFAIEHQLTGPFNATAPLPVSNREFAVAMKKARGSLAIVHPIPAPMLRLITGKLSEALLTGARVIPKRFQEANFHFQFPDIDTALKDLIGK